jgi:hypothetical protein
MAKSDFTCKLCKQVKSAGWVFGTRYRCPDHVFICGDHINFGFFGTPYCKKCDKKVMVYTWFALDEKWVKQ